LSETTVEVADDVELVEVADDVTWMIIGIKAATMMADSIAGTQARE
jgi:hypothetical protein